MAGSHGQGACRRRVPGLLLGALGAWIAVSCARQAPPPGGPPDRLPPLVVGTDPAPLSRVEAGRRGVRFRFSERISERPAQGTLDDAVRISPRTGDLRVEHQRDGLVVNVEGGLRPGLVYRITVLPIIQDLFSNTMSDPFELVFSTGGELHRNVVAGRAMDRITGEPVRSAQAVAVPVDDSLAYVAIADSAGIFALRFLPPAQYRLSVFQDQNRNDEADYGEPQGRRRVAVQATDTVVLEEVALLRPDTTPAVLASVDIRDSLSLELTFDDHLDPDIPLEGAEASLSREEGKSPGVIGVFHRRAFQDLLEARADSLAREAGEEPPEEEEEEESPEEEAPERILPQRTAFVLLASALEPGAVYELRVSNVTNIAGTGGGGGTATVEVPEPPPDTTVADTAAVPDTAAAPPDTTLFPDTVRASDTVPAPDTTGPPDGTPPPDTTAPADTTSPPDTSDPAGLRRRSAPSVPRAVLIRFRPGPVPGGSRR